MRSSGANISLPRLALVSKVALELLSAGRQCETMLGLNRAASHTIRSSERDVRKMAQLLWDSEVAVDKGEKGARVKIRRSQARGSAQIGG